MVGVAVHRVLSERTVQRGKRYRTGPRRRELDSLRRSIPTLKPQSPITKSTGPRERLLKVVDETCVGLKVVLRFKGRGFVHAVCRDVSEAG